MARAIAVAVAVPRLHLDRPFTYLLPEDVEAPLGSLVSVTLRGRTVRGWVLGPTADVPPRVLPIRRVLSKVPVFDERGLRLFRWMSERYVAPLATVIERAHPARVASEEGREAGPGAEPRTPSARGALAAYRGGEALLAACRGGAGAHVARPLPDEEATACLEAVAACLDGGRDAVVVVPEVDPLPATARALLDAVGPGALLFAGGDRRARYGAWLDILAGRYRVVVGTRPAVFAPVRRLGLVWVHRDAHSAHREERAPYYHVREVGLARARLEGAVCVLAGLAPSAEAAALVDDGRAALVRPARARERTDGPLVETTRPEGEDRSGRLAGMLRSARGAFLLLSRRGYGVARVCRRCREPARCEACAGPIALREAVAACAVCGAAGRCPACGGTRFGVERGGTERVEEWAGRISPLPVVRVGLGEPPVPPGGEGVIVGTAAAVKDFGPRRVDLVAVLDADRARRRAGLDAPEQVLATWMEAAAWAGPRSGRGRVLVQTREPGDPAVQALVRWDPWHLHRLERRRREEAGFPLGAPVFRVAGTESLTRKLEAQRPLRLLTSGSGDETVCLVAVRPEDLPAFRSQILDLAAEGTVTRVEAEPRL